jgi:hypothetical protein
MRDKLSGNSFVDPRAAPAADLIETALKSILKRGLICGQPLLTLQSLVSMLCDPALLLEHSQKIIYRNHPKDILAILDYPDNFPDPSACEPFALSCEADAACKSLAAPEDITKEEGQIIASLGL